MGKNGERFGKCKVTFWVFKKENENQWDKNQFVFLLRYN
jgi:hypothetical protein